MGRSNEQSGATANADQRDLADALRIAGWDVHPASSELIRGSKCLRLEPKVMDVLVLLARHPGQVLTRTEIEAQVWPNVVVGYDTVTGAVQKLRKALGDNPREPAIIETLPKRGYRLIAMPEPIARQTPATATARPESAAPSRPRPGHAWLATAVAVIVAALVWWQLRPDHTPPGPPPHEPATASIAVLPFDNLSDDPKQNYFADGLTDDLITLLAKQPRLLVIARDSSFIYRGQIDNITEVAERLGVRYLLRGSVRRVADELRVNAQMIDSQDRGHVWAEQYQRTTNDLFRIQDAIASSVVAALLPNADETISAAVTRSDEPAAYDQFLYGRQSFYLYANRNENRAAREFFTKAVEIDPGFAGAWAMLAWTHAFDAMNGWADDRIQSLTSAYDLATRAIGLQPDLPVAYFVRGLSHRERGDYVKALVEAEKAIEYDPNYANGHLLTATLLYYAGRPEEGLKRIQQAMRINPHHPYNYPFHLGQAYFVLHRYAEAIQAFRDGLVSNPASERLHLWLAAAYARAGAIEDAKWEAEQVRTLNPEFSLERIRTAFPFKDPAELEHFTGALALAGLDG
ncbi:MAG: tetratricopeptide repeat protein [Chromatiales bacterium]|nr:tetratricopeptide repeat protein [Chromatiales bacterium]